MDMAREELVQTRIELLKQMNQYIINIGDEEIWMDWITIGIPDGATIEDYQFIAYDDKEWADICILFGKLVKYEEEEE